jgi:multiple sugar transport system permease protein
MIMGMIGVFQIFESAFVMTDGGPADSTLFYAYKLFNEAFRYLNMGVASAMAWILFLIVFALTLFQLWLGKKWVHYGG